MSEVKTRPILFSAPMVCALIDRKKTQTRRVIKNHPLVHAGFSDDFIKLPENYVADDCPYGKVGDRLWVRETWGVNLRMVGNTPHEQVCFRATNPKAVDNQWLKNPVKWKPSIHLKKCLARIELEIIDLRVERLMELSDQDAINEGLSKVSKDGKLYKYGIPDQDGLPGTDNHGWEWQDWCVDPVEAFKRLWDSINGKHETKCWDANPWVWVIDFKVVSTTGLTQ